MYTKQNTKNTEAGLCKDIQLLIAVKKNKFDNKPFYRVALIHLCIDSYVVSYSLCVSMSFLCRPWSNQGVLTFKNLITATAAADGFLSSQPQ